MKPPKRWTPHGAHRVPEPGSFRELTEKARMRAAAEAAPAKAAPVKAAKAPPLTDTVAFNVAETWPGPVPKNDTGTNWAPIPFADAAGVFDPVLFGAMRRDYEELPGFRGTVRALTDASPTGFAGLHMRTPSPFTRGNQ